MNGRNNIAAWLLAIAVGGLAGCVESGSDGGGAAASADAGPANGVVVNGVVVNDESRISNAELERLRRAAATDIVRVSVWYAGSQFEPDPVRREANAIEARRNFASLMTRLGNDGRRIALGAPIPESGQVVLHVTARGLDILVAAPEVKYLSGLTPNALVSLTPAQEEAIEGALATRGEVELQIVLSVDAQDFDIDRDGRLTYTPSVELDQQSAELRERLLSAAGDRVLNLDAARVADPGRQPVLRLRVARAGYYFLRAREEVLSMQPADWRDISPPEIDDVAAYYREEAARWASSPRPDGGHRAGEGELSAILTLRLGAAGYSSTQVARERAAVSCRAILAQVLVALGDDMRWHSAGDCSGASVTLTPAGVEKLRSSTDRRVASLRFVPTMPVDMVPIEIISVWPILTTVVPASAPQ